MELTLADKLLLLALDDNNGHVVSSASLALPYALAGAVLFDLILSERIKIRGNKLVDWSTGLPDDKVMREIHKVIMDVNKEKTLKYWVNKITISKGKFIKQSILEKLIAAGVLNHDERKMLWVIPYSRYPTDDFSIENKLRRDLHLVVSGEMEMNDETYILLSLIGVSHLEKEVFSRELLKKAKNVCKQAMKNESLGTAVSDTVQAVQAALLVCCILPVINT